MKQTMTLSQLTNRILRLEKEVGSIHKDLAELRQHAGAISQMPATQSAVTYQWADKTVQLRWMNDLFAALSIQGKPIGAEVLQQRISEIGLHQDELSRSLIAMREE
jgi:hypothetical protein